MSNNPIRNTACDILSQLSSTISQLTPAEYSLKLNTLSGNSVGKHVRHLIDFYNCLIRGYELKLIDYDIRIRNEKLENDPVYAIESLNNIKFLLQLNEDCPLVLNGKYGDDEFAVNTTYERELVYNIEHSIHHMAIIKIALQCHFQAIKVPADFGIAHSTLKHQQTCVQ